MEQNQESDQHQIGAVQAVSRTSTPAVDTSPLSELSGTPSLEVSSVSRRVDAERVEARVDGDDEDSADEQPSDELTYGCQHCSKTYVSQEQLTRHLRENRSTCAKSRLGISTSGSVYACPRCDAQMSKKYSTERHIKDSCWKVCDECCKAHNATCDAFFTDGACKHCAQQGLACTKHTVPVPDCDPELLVGAPPQPYKSAPRSSRVGTAAQHDKGKRKATESPGASAKSKPVAKRAAAAAKKEKTTIAGPSHGAAGLRPSHVSQFAPDEKLRNHMPIEQSIPVSGLSVLGHQQSLDYVQTEPASRPTFMCQHAQGSQGHPVPPLPPQIPRLIPGQQYNGRDVVTPHQVLARWPQTHNSTGRMAYIVGANGEILNQSAIDRDEMLQNLHIQQARIEAMAAQYNNGRRVPTPPYPTLPPQDACRTEFNDTHPAESRLNRFRPVQSANFKMYEEAAHRALRPNDFIASAPGSRMPSRQSSPQPAPDLRAPARLPPREQTQGMNTTSQAIKGPVVRELTQPIAMQRSSSPVADENDPVMTLRIHSNTYDVNSTPIFSILTIRASQKFGPRLEAYCQQRNKQYGVDWVFIYEYAIGGPEDAGRERYIKIDYNMTPNDVHDIERPEIKLRDMDTIVVMKGKSRIAAMVENSRNGIETPLSPIGSQVSEENVDIINGETPIYQNAGTIANWHRVVETKMMELRGQVTGLISENQRQKAALTQQNQMLGDLIKRNTDLLLGKHPHAAGRGAQPFPFAGQSAANYHPGLQRGPPIHRNAFMNRLESVREPATQNASQNQMQQYHFPTYFPGMQGRRPTYDSGTREAFPDFQRAGVPTMQPAQFSAYGMGGNMASHVYVPQHMQRSGGGGSGGSVNASASRVEDVEMGE